MTDREGPYLDIFDTNECHGWSKIASLGNVQLLKCGTNETGVFSGAVLSGSVLSHGFCPRDIFKGGFVLESDAL